MPDPVSQIPPPVPGAVLLKAAHSGYEPDIWIVGEGGDRAVLKTFDRCPAVIRQTLGRWITSREVRTLRSLEGIPGIPALVSRDEPWAFTMAYMDGDSLPGRRKFCHLEPEWFERLADLTRAMHARGINHGDIRRTNILRHRESGEPCLVDFAQSLHLGNPRTPIGRMIRDHAFRVDLITVYKLKAYYTGHESLTEQEMQSLRDLPPLLRLGRFLKKRVYKPFRHTRDRLLGRERG